MKKAGLTRFTSMAMKALNNARSEAGREKLTTIHIRHVLIGLAQLPVGESTASHILNGHGITAEKLRGKQLYQESQPSQWNLGEDVQHALEQAAAIARRRDDHAIASAHLLAGILKDSTVDQALEPLGVNREKLSQALESLAIWTNEP